MKLSTDELFGTAVSECTRSHAKHRARRAPLRRVHGSLCLAAPADCPLLHHTPYSLSGSITHRDHTHCALSGTHDASDHDVHEAFASIHRCSEGHDGTLVTSGDSVCTRWACSWRSDPKLLSALVKCITSTDLMLTACLPLPTPPLAGHGRRAAPRTLVLDAPAAVNALPLAVVLAAVAVGPHCGSFTRHLPGHYATGNERQTGVVRKRRRRRHGAVLRWSWR